MQPFSVGTIKLFCIVLIRSSQAKEYDMAAVVENIFYRAMT